MKLMDFKQKGRNIRFLQESVYVAKSKESLAFLIDGWKEEENERWKRGSTEEKKCVFVCVCVCACVAYCSASPLWGNMRRWEEIDYRWQNDELVILNSARQSCTPPHTHKHAHMLMHAYTHTHAHTHKCLYCHTCEHCHWHNVFSRP